MTSFDSKNPRDIDYLFDWNNFKPELVGDLPPKYHKEVIENFDLQRFFLIKSQEVEFVKVVFGFPSLGVQSMKTRDFKLNKFFKNYDDFYAKVKSTMVETQNCIKASDEKSDTYRQCLVESRKKFDEIFDECLGFYDQELPYVNPLMKHFAS